MKLLLDENLPKRLKEDFANHEVYSVTDKGWNGLKNGILLQKLLENNFNALITFDKNIRHQQNFKKYPITIFVLSARINKYSLLTALSPKILDLLNEPLIVGPVEIK